MNKYTLLLPLLLFLFQSCEKEVEGCLDPATEALQVEAEVVWSGGIELDGCGFFIHIGGKSYKPQNEGELPDAYKKAEPTPITLTYNRPQAKIRYSCGMMSHVEFDALRILHISPR